MPSQYEDHGALPIQARMSVTDTPTDTRQGQPLNAVQLVKSSVVFATMG